VAGASALTAVSGVVRTRRLQLAAAGLLLVLLAALLGPVGGILTASGHAFVIFFVFALFLPVLFWRVRVSPAVLFAVVATSIERFSDPGPDAITAKVHLFQSFQEAYGIPGGIISPVELLLILAMLVWLARGVSERHVRMRASPLGVGVMVLLAMAVAMELFGMARGGVFNISLWELRPFLYVAATYLIASQLVGGRGALEAVLWGMVIGTGLKGLEGTERVITMANVIPRPEAILEHDESFFFSCFIALTVALWLFRKRGNLRRVATAFLPLVLVADLGNNRRAAWVMLPAMLLALGIVTYVRTPGHRKAIASVMGVLLLLGSGYVLAFRNSTSLAAEPAHAVWSQFQPDPRDSNSNLYRQLENANLALDIKVAAFTGTGFGVPIAHPIPLYDASNIDPLINFIPHNNILYLWLRLGTLGAIAFWWLIGAALVAACRLARHPDRTLGLFGGVAMTAVMAWLVQGWLDVGITSFRIVLLVGTLLGAVAAGHRIAASEAEAPAAADAVPARPRVLPYPGTLREPAAARSLTGS
jgi:O-Antigen ligase